MAEKIEGLKMAEKLKASEIMKLGPGLYGDGGGLWLVVQESGSRSWKLRTMVKGRRCEIGLGGIQTRGLLEARAEAARLRSQARLGVDIVGDKRAAKVVEERQNSIPTFKEAAIEYHKTLTAPPKATTAKKKKKGVEKPRITSETHAHNWLQSLELYIFPAFGDKSVDQITSDDVKNAIIPIWNTIPDTAARTLRRVAKVFDSCASKRNIWIENGKVPIPMANPCIEARTALPRHRSIEGHHQALHYGELPAFIQKLRVSNHALSVKLALEFTVLTCARTADVIGLTWPEIDMDQKLWILPAERSKTKRQEHRVPLSARCIEILTFAKQFNEGPIVFPGRYQGEGLSDAAMLMTLRRMGYEDLTVHGFRGTFKTWATETTKYDNLVIELAMQHEVHGIEKHYLRSDLFDLRRKLMTAWERFATSTPAAKVVRIRQ
jgi:integrase